MEERLQKIMSHAGIGSRRSCEELILSGRVTVNGRIAEIGQKADPVSDRIVVDGRVISAAEPLVYIALYKPRNVLSAVDPEPNDFRKTVRSLVPVAGHLYPVGRLDFDSEGLILMTNDGELTNKLTHPKFGHQKVYRVLVARRPDDEQLATWRRGVVLEDGYKTAPADVSFEASSGKGAWLRVVMREGRKRQIRETGSLLGLPVVRILRIAIGSLRLGTLKPGDWRYLTDQEVADLKDDGPKRETYPQGQRTQRRSTFNRSSSSSDSRPERSPRPSGGKSFNRGPSSGAADGKPYGRKPSSGDTSGGKSFERRPSDENVPDRKSYSRKPSSGDASGRKPFERRPSDENTPDRKSYSRKPSSGDFPDGKSFERRPSSGKASGGKPYGRKPPKGNTSGKKPGSGRGSGGTSGK